MGANESKMTMAVSRVPRRRRSTALVLHTSTDCVLTIEHVTFQRAGRRDTARSGIGDTFGFAANAATQRRIWGKHAMWEYINAPVTAVHQEFTYLEDQTLGAVWGAQAAAEGCWHDGFGWNILVCAADTYLNGDQQVERWTFGRFRNNGFGGIEHTLEARPQAQVGWSTTRCIHSGARPAGWSLSCDHGVVY